MNWLDFLIGAILVWSGWSGFKRGLVTEACRTGSALLALFVAFRFSDPWSVDLTLRFGIAPAIARALTLTALLLGTVTAGFAVEPWIRRLFHTGSGGLRIDQWGGMAAGLIKGGVLVFIGIVGAGELPWSIAHHAIGDSFLALHMLRLAPAVYGPVHQLIPTSGWSRLG